MDDEIEMPTTRLRRIAAAIRTAKSLELRDDAVGKTRFDGLFRLEIGIGGRKLENAFDRHTAVTCDNASSDVSDTHKIVRPGLHGQRIAAGTGADERVVDHDAAMRQNLAIVPRNEQQCRHACGHTQANGSNRAAYSLHDVVKSQAGLDFTTRTVDVKRDGGPWDLRAEDTSSHG